MVKTILIATFGSLGDLYPELAIGIELQKRGNHVTIAAMETYREVVQVTGLKFFPIRPCIDYKNDHELTMKMADVQKGTDYLMMDIIMPNLKPMYEDLLEAASGADAIVTGAVVYVAGSLVEKTKIKWVSTALAPLSFMSSYDPSVLPTHQRLRYLRILGPSFHKGLLRVARLTRRNWLVPYKEFRKEIGMSEDHDPIFKNQFSSDLHLALFSKSLGTPQPDWPSCTVQTGICCYDGPHYFGNMPIGLDEFLDVDDAPIVFTLGSVASFDAGDFFEQSIKAANILKRRAVLIFGSSSASPSGLDKNIVGYNYAPYSKVFPRAACVVHQGGVGTTQQVLQAGVPMLVVPYGFDQPDNAARCYRLGVARVVPRKSYRSSIAAKQIRFLLDKPKYLKNAKHVKETLDSEKGVITACDAIEALWKD